MGESHAFKCEKSIAWKGAQLLMRVEHLQSSPGYPYDVATCGLQFDHKVK